MARPRQRVAVMRRSPRCRLCAELPGPSLSTINALIWPVPNAVGPLHRAQGYRKRAVEACAEQGLSIEAKTVTSHAEHVERSARIVSKASRPADDDEEPVLSLAYADVSDTFVRLGLTAAEAIEQRIDEFEPRELVATARMGLQASAQREALRIRAQQAADTTDLLRGVFGLASELISEADVPDAEIINVTPVEVILDEVSAEREALKRLQAGEAVGA